MLAAVLLLAAISAVHVIAAALLWRENQRLSKKLLTVVAKSASTPAAVMAEVSPPISPKTEDQILAERETLKIRKALWSR